LIADRYGMPRIVFNKGTGDLSIDLPLVTSRVEIQSVIFGKTKRNLAGYPQGDRLGKWYLVSLDFRDVHETKTYEWTELGTSKTFQFYQFWDFWENHAEFARFFTFYPHYPSSFRPIHYPEVLSSCHIELPSKFKISLTENSQCWHEMKFEFYGRVS